MKNKTTLLGFLMLFCWLIPNAVQAKQSVPITYLGTKKLNGDTTDHLNILSKRPWHMLITYANGQQKNLLTQPDTAPLEGISKVLLFQTFDFDSTLTKEMYAMRFYVRGSVLVKHNHEVILRTGSYSNDTKMQQTSISDFFDIYISDTINTFEIEYIPKSHRSDFDLKLEIGKLSWSKDSIQARIESDAESMALGFYYLSFGIIFMLIFIFSPQQNENLYFALFCLFGAFSFIISSENLNVYIQNLVLFAPVMSIEFLSIFLAKVLLNREKTKIPFLILLFAIIVSFLPYFLFNYGMFQVNDCSIFSSIVFLIAIVYAALSAMWYVLQGFGQKKWEAKAITAGFSVGFLLNVLAPIILAFVFKQDVDNILSKYKIIDYIPQIGLCFYPLTVAYVLGVRHGNNQKQLVDQLVYIEKLGKENLLKESEKKKILEEQNSILEHMVAQRTQELALKNELIMVKNREITDNVTYAKRIQAAILPNRKIIQQHLPQSFILYMPKDIVSGDFYGFSIKDNKIIIAAADCTGHGVAGAFMSMVGSSLFNQIINERNITTPAKILDELNEGIIDSLKQRYSDSNDGMDIAICTFDTDFKNLEFAGANRPLWLIRNGNLHATTPNKFPIGGMQVLHDEKFTNHHIELLPDDTIYIFSDGYADQFGEVTGKKLMTKKFKEILLNMQHETMATQKEKLRQVLLSWQGATEQVDDIIVIGIRI